MVSSLLDPPTANKDHGLVHWRLGAVKRFRSTEGRFILLPVSFSPAKAHIARHGSAGSLRSSEAAPVSSSAGSEGRALRNVEFPRRDGRLGIRTIRGEKLS